MAEIEQITIAIIAIEQAVAQITAVSASLDGLGAAATRTNVRVGGLNKTMIGAASVARGMFIRIAALTVASVALGLATRGTIGAFLDFEDSFVRIRKTVDLTEVEFRRLERANRDLAKVLPVSVNEINRIGEIAGQLGIQGVANILKFEETIARVAVTTNLTADAAATDFARLAAVMQEPVNNIDRMAATIVGLGNNFETTEAEILSFATRISGAGAVIGLATSDVLALGAAFTAAGVKIERGGTAVFKVLISMQKAVVTGGEDLVIYAAALQQTGEQFAEAFRADPIQTFLGFVNALSATGEDAVRVLDALGFTGARLAGSFLQMASAEDKVNEAVALSSLLWQENTAHLVESEKQFATTRNQLKLAANNWNDLGISIGKVAAPALVEFSKVAILASEHIHLVTTALLVFGGVLALTLVSIGIVAGPLGWLLLLVGLAALIGGVTLFGSKWEEIFAELPLPVQEMAISVLETMDALLIGFVDSLNSMIIAVQNFSSSITSAFEGIPVIGPFFKGMGERLLSEEKQAELRRATGGYPPAPGSLLIPAPPTIAGLDKLRTEFLNNRFKKLFEIAFGVGKTADEQEFFKIPELDLGDFLDSLDTGAEKATKAAKEIDILADGIITLAEATKHGISIIQAAQLELGHEAGEAASRLFRVAVELEKLDRRTAAGNRREGRLRAIELEIEYQQALRDTNIEMGQLIDLLAGQGLSDRITLFANAMVNLGQSFRTAEESVLGFLTRLVRASLDFTQQTFDALFRRPTVESAANQLALSQLQVRRARLLVGGGTEQELAALIDPIDREIAALERSIDVRQAEFGVMRALADLADSTLLTDRELLAESNLLIGAIATQSALMGGLNLQIADEQLELIGANAALASFTQALMGARDVLFGGGRTLPVAGPTTIDIHINTTAEELVERVAEETREALRDVGLGGQIRTSGAFA